MQRRLRRLRAEGWIRRFVALLDPTLLDREFTVFVSLELDPESVDGDDDIGRSLDALPEVIECHRVTGPAQYLIKVVTSDPVAFLAIDRRLTELPGFRRASRHVSLATIKTTTELPVPERTRDLRRRWVPQ